MKGFNLKWLIVLVVIGLGVGAYFGLAKSPVEEAVGSFFAEMPTDSYRIGEKEFVAKVKADEPMFILDIRRADDYAKGHIKGAVNAPWGTAISDNLELLPQDQTIMVYCYSGQTAGQAVALLNMAGFDAKSVNLGWNLGISKVEGIDEIMETEENTFDGETVTINKKVKAAIVDYFQGMEQVKGTTYTNYMISVDDAKALLDEEDPDVVFLSIRRADDYINGHIESAINIPFGKGMEVEFNTLPKDKKIIVYCYSGQTAGQTVAGLRMLGYDAVSMNGGTGTPATAPNGWVNKGYPLVK